MSKGNGKYNCWECGEPFSERLEDEFEEHLLEHLNNAKEVVQTMEYQLDNINRLAKNQRQNNE